MDIEIRKNDIYFNVRCSCIIKDISHSKVLLTYMRGINGGYMLPGGRINLMETTFDCICREINEELGINLNYKLISIDEDFDKDKLFHMIDFVFYAEINSFNEINSLDDGWDKFIIVDINEIDNYDVRPISIKKLIKKEPYNNIVHNVNNDWLNGNI